MRQSQKIFTTEYTALRKVNLNPIGAKDEKF